MDSRREETSNSYQLYQCTQEVLNADVQQQNCSHKDSVPGIYNRESQFEEVVLKDRQHESGYFEHSQFSRESFAEEVVIRNSCTQHVMYSVDDNSKKLITNREYSSVDQFQSKPIVKEPFPSNDMETGNSKENYLYYMTRNTSKGSSVCDQVHREPQIEEEFADNEVDCVTYSNETFSKDTVGNTSNGDSVNRSKVTIEEMFHSNDKQLGVYTDEKQSKEIGCPTNRVSSVASQFMAKEEVSNTKTDQEVNDLEVSDTKPDQELKDLSIPNQERQEREALLHDNSQDKSEDKNDTEAMVFKIEEELKVCRICYDNEDVENLCSPCKCSGSIGFVHQSCMFHWIGGRPKLHCEICQHKYAIKRTTKPFSEWGYPWITHHDLYFIFMVIFSQEWIHVMESFILLISMYTINVVTESSGAGIQFWVIIGLELAYYCTHYICGLILLFVRKWSCLNQRFTLLNYDAEHAVRTTWFSEDESKLLYCLDMLVSFLLANPILKGMADKMVARAQ